MKRIVCFIILICAVPGLLCACGAGKDPGGTSAPAEEMKVRESDFYPSEIRYERGETAADKAKTTDTYTIDDVLDALGQLTVKEKTTVDAGTPEEVIVLVAGDGEFERLVFRGEALLKDTEFYRVEGLDALRPVLDKMMEQFGGYDHPYAFTATPFIDESSGYYWIFYESGCGARFTGFDGAWFINGELIRWGVDEGVLYIFPADGETEAYPFSYGEDVDDDDIYLSGGITLHETYPGALDALYGQWVPIGKEIEKRLEAAE